MRTEKQQKRFDEIVEDLNEIFHRQPGKGDLEFLAEFKATPRDDLTKYHHSLGRAIRNEFELWYVSCLTEGWRTNEAGRDIRDGVDYSEDHPDHVSTQLMEAFWDKLHA
jgi:hypothetical protein